MTDRQQTPVSRAAVERVADDSDLSAEALRAALGDLQSLASDSPGVASVDDLVYEWRTAFRDDPLVERTPDAYYLAVPARVWADFAERLDWSDAERDAVETVHATTLSNARETDVDGLPMVLGR